MVKMVECHAVPFLVDGFAVMSSRRCLGVKIVLIAMKSTSSATYFSLRVLPGTELEEPAVLPLHAALPP